MRRRWNSLGTANQIALIGVLVTILGLVPGYLVLVPDHKQAPPTSAVQPDELHPVIKRDQLVVLNSANYYRIQVALRNLMSKEQLIVGLKLQLSLLKMPDCPGVFPADVYQIDDQVKIIDNSGTMQFAGQAQSVSAGGNGPSKISKEGFGLRVGIKEETRDPDCQQRFIFTFNPTIALKQGATTVFAVDIPKELHKIVKDHEGSPKQTREAIHIRIPTEDFDKSAGVVGVAAQTAGGGRPLLLCQSFGSKDPALRVSVSEECLKFLTQ
jgi:hypothetical protein